MKTLCLLAMLLIAPPAWASTITFEPGSDWLDWQGSFTVLTIDQAQYRYDYINTTVFPSGTTVAYNGYGVNWQSFDGPLSTVEGMWMSPLLAYDTWYEPYSAHSVTVDGYANFQWVGTTVWDLTPGFQYYETGFTEPIDWLWLRMPGGGHQWYLMDDLTLTVMPGAVRRVYDTASVPEPATWILLFGGLTLVLAASKIVTHPKARL